MEKGLIILLLGVGFMATGCENKTKENVGENYKHRKRKKPCKYTLQGFAIICFDILRYGRDSNPRPPA